jgi:tripartite-type tricarboxylate transporter receptor subunit TctC
MAKKPGIPAINLPDRTLNQMLSAMRENLGIITGAIQGIGEIDQLSSTATTAQIISKINEIIKRLNASGN